MNTHTVLVLVLTSLLVNCARPPVPLTPLAVPSEAQGTVTHEEVVPEKGELPPHPELTQEERERLLQGTEREAPPAR